MVNSILRIDPTASPKKAEQLAKVWNGVVNLIIEEMFARAKPQMNDLHVDLREEIALELAKLIFFISEKVVADRMNGRLIDDIDPQDEHQQCFNKEGKEYISNTAQIYADRVWLRIYSERWKPKTEAALRKEKQHKKTFITPKKVEENHFIPKSFIKRYWAEGQFVYRNIKRPEGLEAQKKTPLGNWGFRKNLYSDKLEAYLGLLEGDAVRPIQMLLNVEPLNRPQREALVGFIVIQRIRNPHFMESLEKSVAPVVASEVGPEKVEDKEYMRAVYETLYSQNDFYDKLARPIMHSRWVIARSETPDFVLPDVCNLFGDYENGLYVVMPLTPTDCLIVLPFEIDKPRIVPHHVKVSGSMLRDLSYVLRCAAKEEFLSGSGASFAAVEQEPNQVMKQLILEFAKTTSDGLR
ncbi:DUF4238 domain-containing protein [Desulfobulbus elongatus]|uniref:DUF4238 domain-containing protein n=1 Tax=Desulfobulbus elongatus TaxID=53332 RepID=UPI000A020914|nr:DUF4238 domain-containing protein [Desulfobulbus elongatus]